MILDFNDVASFQTPLLVRISVAPPPEPVFALLPAPPPLYPPAGAPEELYTPAPPTYKYNVVPLFIVKVPAVYAPYPARDGLFGFVAPLESPPDAPHNSIL